MSAPGKDPRTPLEMINDAWMTLHGFVYGFLVACAIFLLVELIR